MVGFLEVREGVVEILPAVQRVAHQAGDVRPLGLAEFNAVSEDHWGIVDQAVVLLRLVKQLGHVNRDHPLEFGIVFQRFESFEGDLGLAFQIGNVAEVVPCGFFKSPRGFPGLHYGKQVQPGVVVTFHFEQSVAAFELHFEFLLGSHPQRVEAVKRRRRVVPIAFAVEVVRKVPTRLTHQWMFGECRLKGLDPRGGILVLQLNRTGSASVPRQRHFGVGRIGIGRQPRVVVVLCGVVFLVIPVPGCAVPVAFGRLGKYRAAQKQGGGEQESLGESLHK